MTSDRSIITDRFWYSYRFRNPYPFSEKRLIKILEKQGFAEYSDPNRVFVSKGRAVPVVVLEKDENEVVFNPMDGTLGVEGIEVEDVNKDIGLLKKVITEDLKIDVSEINFSELISRTRVESINTALMNIASLVRIKDKDKMKGIGNDSIVYSFSICPEGTEGKSEDFRNIKNWYHIEISPFVPNPKYYLINIVYRNEDLKKVEDFSNGLREKIVSFINEIEKE